MRRMFDAKRWCEQQHLLFIMCVALSEGVAWQTADACNKASPHSCRPLSNTAIPHCL